MMNRIVRYTPEKTRKVMWKDMYTRGLAPKFENGAVKQFSLPQLSA
jgi:hypothetical protein